MKFNYFSALLFIIFLPSLKAQENIQDSIVKEAKKVTADKQAVTITQDNRKQQPKSETPGSPGSTSDSSNPFKMEASFPGGAPAWSHYLIKNLRYPYEAQLKNIQGVIVVQFTVDEKGRLRDIHVVSGPDVLRKEAVRVVRKSGKWLPAREAERAVKSQKEQMITFRTE